VARSVLVVDDDAGFRDVVGRVLDGSGFVVIAEAGCASDAVARAAECRPDTALVDVGLPDGDGFSLATTLRAMPWSPRVVLVSTDGDASSTPAARRAGACGFLRKDELSASSLRHLLENG
jgi:DNA-binding NarL/FixJ family response regulator